MFGDKPLVGQYSYSIDEKNRMFLPSSTGRETGDRVYLCYDNDIEVYTLYPEKVIQEIFDNFNKKIMEAKTASELKEYKLMLLKYSKSVIKGLTVDSQGRVILSSEFWEYDSMNMVGAGNHLVLNPTNKKNKK